MKRIGTLMVVPLAALLAAALLGGCAQLLPAGAQQPAATPVATAVADAPVIVEGQLTPRDDARLVFPIGGEVAEVLVEAGQKVAAGDVLARLGEAEALQAQLAAAELELAGAQRQHATLVDDNPLAYRQAVLAAIAAQRALTDAQEQLAAIDTDAYQDQIDETRTRVADAKDAVDDAQAEFDRFADLADDNASRQTAEDNLQAAQTAYDQVIRERDRLLYDLEQAEAQVALAGAQLDEAAASRDARQAGPDPDDLNLAQKRLDNAQAQVAAAQAALEHLDLVAPFGGTIVEVDVAPGEWVSPSRVVIVLADFSEWYVDTRDLTEFEVVLIPTDRPVTIVPDALPGLSLAGRVVSINDAYTERAGDVLYETRIRLDEADPRLRWGMTVEVWFDDD